MCGFPTPGGCVPENYLLINQPYRLRGIGESFGKCEVHAIDIICFVIDAGNLKTNLMTPEFRAIGNQRISFEALKRVFEPVLEHTYGSIRS